jgi:hypothetical protein
MPFTITVTGAELSFKHSNRDLKFHLSVYSIDAADPDSDNGGGAHVYPGRV